MPNGEAFDPPLLTARTLASGEGWTLSEFLCRAGPDNRPFEERHDGFSLAAVISGQFVYRGDGGVAHLVPGALLTGFMLFRKRRRLPMLAALLVLFAMVATLGSTGCASGLSQSGTPAGTYTFQVTAHGQGTGVSESQTMTLTVTQ